ncbi:MAG: DUF3102 domain-containing protein [Desulfosporosinus sp.]|nr:DUF3102 domain-containing protein [Desulfosporosinus sp.]
MSTEKGSVGRLGSVITTLALKPTKRNYQKHDEYCLYLTQGKCGACMRRCPPHAITAKGKDHQICEEYISREVLSRWAPRTVVQNATSMFPVNLKIRFEFKDDSLSDSSPVTNLTYTQAFILLGIQEEERMEFNSCWQGFTE